MDIQEEIRNELIRLDMPVTSWGGFQLDRSRDPAVIRVDYEGVTGADLLTLLRNLPDEAGSIVVVEAIRLSRERH